MDRRIAVLFAIIAGCFLSYFVLYRLLEPVPRSYKYKGQIQAIPVPRPYKGQIHTKLVQQQKIIKEMPFMPVRQQPIKLGEFDGQTVIVETFKTKSFNITINRYCLDASITCNNVTYVGRDLNTGKSIRLKGRTMNRMCADRVTPCLFLGYEFRNKNYRYLVTAEGTLQVYQGTKLLVNEEGTWDSQN